MVSSSFSSKFPPESHLINILSNKSSNLSSRREIRIDMEEIVLILEHRSIIVLIVQIDINSDSSALNSWIRILEQKIFNFWKKKFFFEKTWISATNSSVENNSLSTSFESRITTSSEFSLMVNVPSGSIRRIFVFWNFENYNWFC